MKWILILLLGFWNCQKAIPAPEPKKGFLDLQEWSLSEKGSILLRGEWEFYWNHFLFPEDFQNPASLPYKDYIFAPSVWNQKTYQGILLPGYGSGTYRLNIKLHPKESRDLSLYMLEQAHAYRLFVNGEMIREMGKVGNSEESSSPDFNPAIHSFTVQGDALEIIIHVSNFQHRVGGLRNELELGTTQKIKESVNKKTIMEMFLYGGFFFISIYHIAIFYYRRNNSAPFYFALLSIFIMFFSAIVGDRVLYNLYPNIWSWEANYKMEFSFVSLIVLSTTLFLDHLFPEKNKGYILYSRFIKVYSISFFLFVLLFPAKIFTEYYILLVLLMAIASIGILVNVSLAIKRKKEGAIEFLFGFSILIFFTAHDILVAYSVINDPILIKFGLTGMILSQAILMAKIFTKDFFRAESLASSLREINTAYSRFVPTEFLNLLDKTSILDIKIGTHSQKTMTILFVDIRSFTTISEAMSPRENFEFLNSYLNRIVPIIKDNNGFIDKYIGDAIMALFPGKVDDAVHSAIQIHSAIREYNQHREKSGYQPISVGAGIHCGNLILGTIGHDDRMEGTVISDAVNLASRIEGLTKHYQSPILLSEEAFQELENINTYKYRILDNVRVKGKKKSIYIIEILDGHEPSKLELFLQTRDDFDKGTGQYKQKKFEECIIYFENVVKTNPFDYAAKIYLERAKHYKEFGPPIDWEGIQEMEK